MPELRAEAVLNALLALLLLIAPLGAHALGEPYYVALGSRVAILALAGVGLNLALGNGGMVSFGHAAFFGLGGYTAGILAHHAFEGTPLLPGIDGSDLVLVLWPAAIGVAAIAACLIGALSLRTSGVYFIMITLAFAQMIFYLAISIRAYGGEDGLSLYLPNTLPGLDLGDDLHLFAVCFVLLMLALALSARIVGSRFGAALQCARQNERRLAAVGIAPYPIKLTGFVLSAMITGLAGALFVELNSFVSPAMLSWHRSGEIMIFVILGGVGRLFGPVAGAALFVLLEAVVGGMTERWQLILGLILLGVVLFARGGLIGLIAGPPRHD